MSSQREKKSNNQKKLQQTIDINCDLGEIESAHGRKQDAQIMRFISRCNIACGGHAGSLETMRQSLINARHTGIKAGAHPGYPDKDNFGRVSMTLSFNQLSDSLRRQIDQLIDVATQEKQHLKHIKLHGALYNDAEQSKTLAFRLVELLSHHYPKLSIVGLSHGQMQHAAQSCQVDFFKEGFMDRAYQNSGLLSPRSQKGSVLTSTSKIIQQAIRLASQLSVKTPEGDEIMIPVDTICLHGDTKDAIKIAQQLQLNLKALGVAIQ